MTSIEKITKNIIESLGFMVKPHNQKNTTDPLNTIYSQVPEDKFRLDFALINAKVAIEAQGSYWHGTFSNNINAHQLQRKIEDLTKSIYLRKCDWKLIYVHEFALKVNPALAAKRLRDDILNAIDI